jgi:hypothetical protein
MRRHFAVISDILDHEERYDENKSLVEYGGFFANPDVYGEVKRREEQTRNATVENFDEAVAEMRRQAREEAQRKAGDLVPIIEEKQP